MVQRVRRFKARITGILDFDSIDSIHYAFFVLVDFSCAVKSSNIHRIYIRTWSLRRTYKEVGRERRQAIYWTCLLRFAVNS